MFAMLCLHSKIEVVHEPYEKSLQQVQENEHNSLQNLSPSLKRVKSTKPTHQRPAQA